MYLILNNSQTKPVIKPSDVKVVAKLTMLKTLLPSLKKLFECNNFEINDFQLKFAVKFFCI